jgi:hypothetical protein
MKNHQRIMSLALTLGMFCAFSLSNVMAHAAEGTKLTEEFHHTYPLNTGGSVSLDNINGPVHISSWDRNEVKVDAIKSAYSQERLNDAHIEVEATSNHISIKTKYPDHEEWEHSRRDNPASVEYTLTVPKSARLDQIRLINGSLDVSNISGEVDASCINGTLTAKDLTGPMKLSSINGRTDASINPPGDEFIKLSAVNGSLNLTLPSDAKARIEANTVTGKIENNFGLHVNNHRYVGHDVRGELGNGGAHIELNNVNGPIEINRANDGHTPSPVKDFNDKQGDGEIWIASCEALRLPRSLSASIIKLRGAYGGKTGEAADFRKPDC